MRRLMRLGALNGEIVVTSTLDQLLALLQVLNCDVDLVVRTKRRTSVGRRTRLAHGTVANREVDACFS